MPVIKLKSNAVASTVPTTGQLELGEVAINTFDGEAYYKKDDGIASIVKLLNNQDIDIDSSFTANSDTKVPSQKAVKTALDNKIANSRYQFVSDTGSTYTIPASAVTENGRTIIELSNNSLTSITVDTATGTGKTSGDSVNISITGTYAAQVLVADGVTLQGDLTFSYQHQTKTLVYKGSNVWKVVG